MSTARWQWRLAQKRAHHELHFLKSLNFSFCPANNHPTVAEFMRRFANDRARSSNPDCEVTVDVVENPTARPSIKAIYENGTEEELDYNQRVQHLVDYFWERRESLRFYSELQFSMKNEEEENPFLNAAAQEGENRKKQQQQAKPAAAKPAAPKGGKK